MIKDLEKAFQFKDYSNIDWDDYKFYQNNKLSEQIIYYFKDKINFNYVCIYTEFYQFIFEYYFDKIDLNSVFLNKKFDQKFIQKYIKKYNKVNWFYISLYQTLSQEFIEKYKYKIDWNAISYIQKLSYDFLKRNLIYINIANLKLNSNIDFYKFYNNLNLFKKIIIKVKEFLNGKPIGYLDA